VDKVTKADIRRVANKVFVESNRTEGWIETEAPKQTEAASQKGGA
jgi:predicted Zn-dependent peptidase